MLVYVLGFAGSCFLIYLVQDRPITSRSFVWGSVVALLIPLLIAGLRAKSIGTDTAGYAWGLFKTAQANSSFNDYLSAPFENYGWQVKTPREYELAFVTLIWLLTRAFGSFGIVLLGIEAMIVVPIYLSLIKLRKVGSPWLGMLLFYLTAFNVTLNMMRQWIALAFLLLAFTYLVERKLMPYGLLVAVGISFHITGIIGLLVGAIYIFLVPGGNSPRVRLFIVSIAIVCSVLCIGVLPFILKLVGLGRFSGYLSGTLHPMPGQLVMRLPSICLIIVSYMQYQARPRHMNCPNLNLFFIAIAVCDLSTSQLASLETGANGDSYMSRITYYFNEYYYILIPYVLSGIRCARRKQLFTVICVVFFCLYWWFEFAYRGYNATIPYMSSLALPR